MKKIVFFLFISSLALCATAATDITSPVVTGHWTLAGSPYKIYNNISIVTGQALTIDPGVNVIFQGPYQLVVTGMLDAAGTSSAPIIFDIQDTTGWYVDSYMSDSGGWTGINLLPYAGTAPDTSAISFCEFHHLKNGALNVFRNLNINHCTLSDNIGDLLHLAGIDSTAAYEVSNCDFFNNRASDGGLLGLHSSLGDWYIHDNNFYNNTIGDYGFLFSCLNSNVLFSRNSIHHNVVPSTVVADVHILVFQSVGSPIRQAVVAENKIYENTTYQSASIYCYNAVVDLYRNYICNNHHVDGSCGFLDGGGGLFLYGTDGNYGEALYTVRNNIIANNYSPWFGGSIHLYNAKALIANNTIVHNKGFYTGGIDITALDTTTVCIRNNIFFGNNKVSFPASTNSVVVYGGSILNLKYDHNWTANSFSADVIPSSTMVGNIAILSDTSTNIIGTDPGLVSPTTSPDYLESALLANFSLLPGSPCIGKGSNSAVTPGSADYGGKARIFGDSVDVGAFEYGAGSISVGPVVSQDTMFKYCCSPIIHFSSSTNYTQTPVTEIPLNVYPNPASSIVFITTPEPKGTIQLIDALGKQVVSYCVENIRTSIDLRSLARGFYYAVWNESAGKNVIQKIVVE